MTAKHEAPFNTPVRVQKYKSPRKDADVLTVKGRVICDELPYEYAEYVAAAINSYAASAKRDEALREALKVLAKLQAWVSHWQEDAKRNFPPTDGSLCAANEKSQQTIATIKELLK